MTEQLIYTFENFLWGYVGVPMLVILGIYLTIFSNFFQIRRLPTIVKTFLGFFKAGDSHATEDAHAKGVHPLKAFFACIGGSVGVGNVVGVCTAVQIGGPGALFWIWITALVGSIVKYSEVYLGMRYRITLDQQGYRGGPMYFLQKAFKAPVIPVLVCFLLCVYGVEVFQFSVVTKNIASNFNLDIVWVTAAMLFLVLFASSGGVRRVGTIASALIPLFVFSYVGMGFWVLWNHLDLLPSLLGEVLHSAFSGHSALGAFAGSSIMLTASQGVRRGCYSGDVGIGYASIIHSETSAKIPEKQASLVVFEILVDTFIICTTSVMLVLITGVWKEPIEGIMLIQTALGNHFSHMNLFMPFFLFLVGYATINGYLCVGLKCAEYLSPSYGRKLYYVYAIVVLVVFSFLDTLLAQSVMAIAGGLLLILNCIGIFRLRHELSFDLDTQKEFEPVVSRQNASL